MTQTVRVNFGRPMPLFPLPGAVLLPHAIQPLHIFEPRYRQMVEDSLGRSRQIAMACLERARERDEDGCLCAALRPVVCVGQIIGHERLDDGRHYIVLHGVCRATIRSLHEPGEGRLYLTANLAPLETPSDPTPRIERVRTDLRRLLTGPRLSRMRGVDTVLEWFDHEDVPTHALLELVAFTLVQDPDLKYRLLAEPDAQTRADLIRRELVGLDRLVAVADRQDHDWPKGMSWN